MIDWLLSLVPWWAWLLGAAAVVGAAWRFLGWQGALAAAAGLVAVLGYGKGRADGLRDEQAGRDRARLDAVKDRKDIDDEVAGMDGTSLDRNFDRWLRDDDR